MALRRWTRPELLLMLAMTIGLVGCATSGAPSVQRAHSPTPSSTPALAQDASPSPTGQDGAQACAAGAGGARMGDLAISAPTVLYGFNADYMLPDGISADKPLMVTLQNNAGFVEGAAVESRPVVQPAAFLLEVCNTSSTASHRLTGYGVMLDTLTSYPGQLNALNGCAFLYSRPTGIGGECASGFSPDDELSFQFPSAAAPGAVATQTPANAVELPPGATVTISFGITPPAGPAIMTYRLGLGVDGAAVRYPAALRAQQAIVAPIARRWAGDYCNTAQMQGQIPTTIPANTYFACPKV